MIRTGLFAALFAISAAASAQTADESVRGIGAMRVPEGFVVELAAEPDLARFPMCATFDPWGRLFVTSSSGLDKNGKEMAAEPECEIYRLVDSDGDGKFDKSTRFADKLKLPMGALWHQNSLFVADPPDLLRLTDSDDDGIADEREVVLTGWNVLNTASLHGPFLGPDGWLYLTHGRHGYKIETKEGATLEGKAARLWRCRPDGSGLERICGGGFDNPVELVFTRAGEMLGMMTYFTDPRDGQRDALMHWVEGGVYPKPHEVVSEFAMTGDFMPTMTKFARIAPAGFMEYKGSAFPAEYRGSLFSAQFNPHRVQRHKLFRAGATFRTEDEDFLTSSDPDFHPTDVIEDADGSLIVLDTGGWYVDACPLSRVTKPDLKGAIYRVRWNAAKKVVDPWGLGLELETKSPRALVDYLLDPRPAVRARTGELLVSAGQKSVKPLRKRFKKAGERERLAVFWALSRIGGESADVALHGALEASDPGLKIAAAHMAGLNRDTSAIEKISALLSDSNPAVVREAATALGRIADASTVPALLRASHRDDRFVDHAVTFALISINDPEATIAALKSEDPLSRREALVALDQMHASNLKPEHVMPFIQGSDESLRKSGLWVAGHHPEWSSEILGFIREELAAAEWPEGREESLRDVIVAFAGNDGFQTMVAERLADDSSTRERRVFLLETVERSEVQPFPPSWIEQIGALLDGDDGELRWRSLSIVRARGIEALDSKVESIATSESENVALRLTALEALASRKKPFSDSTLGFLIAQTDGPDAASRLGAAQIIGKSSLTKDQRMRIAREMLPRADALVLPSLLAGFDGGEDLETGDALVAGLRQSAAGLQRIGTERLDKLFGTYPVEVRKRAIPIFMSAQQAEEGRLKMLGEIVPEISRGDVGRGRAVFYGERAACGTCHAIRREGGDLGPDLTTIGLIRSPHDLLEAVLFPSASFVPDYEPMRIETASDVHAGIISRRTPDAIYVKTGANSEVRIPKSDIKSIEPSTVSVMPEGLQTGLSREELLDLMAFLGAQNGEEWLLPERRQTAKN